MGNSMGAAIRSVAWDYIEITDGAILENKSLGSNF